METIGTSERVEDFICMEHAAPKRRFLSGDGALYLVLLVAVIGVIVFGNGISARLDWPRAPVQISMYALLLLLAWLVYRYRLLTFRYTLTTRMLHIERMIGQKAKPDKQLHLADIESIRPYAADEPKGKSAALYAGRRQDALVLRACVNGQREALVISPSKEFAGKLIEQWKKQKK